MQRHVSNDTGRIFGAIVAAGVAWPARRKTSGDSRSRGGNPPLSGRGMKRTLSPGPQLVGAPTANRSTSNEAAIGRRLMRSVNMRDAAEAVYSVSRIGKLTL